MILSRHHPHFGGVIEDLLQNVWRFLIKIIKHLKKEVLAAAHLCPVKTGHLQY